MKIRYLCLFITAFIWGTAFTAQRAGMDYVGAFTFSSLRNLAGFLCLIPVALIINANGKKRHNSVPKLKNTIAGGVICGILLFIANSFQQFGIIYISAGKSGFITALYVILVPIIGIFLHKRTSGKIWIAVIISVVGLYLLCVNEAGVALGKGEILTILCALFFAIHIHAIDRYVNTADVVWMSAIQFFIVCIMSTVCMFIFEKPDISSILKAIYPILYAGIMSSAVAYTLQIVGQKGTNPSIASLILCLESMISVLAGWIILKEQLTLKHGIGCILMFIAIVIVQFDNKKA